jgi:hypothetical protein
MINIASLWFCRLYYGMGDRMAARMRQPLQGLGDLSVIAWRRTNSDPPHLHGGTARTVSSNS